MKDLEQMLHVWTDRFFLEGRGRFDVGVADFCVAVVGGRGVTVERMERSRPSSSLMAEGEGVEKCGGGVAGEGRGKANTGRDSTDGGFDEETEEREENCK